ncbi:MAG: hypothetical protein Q4E24_10235 [bacterium]|nr:hypothetical protein [bacterium]
MALKSETELQKWAFEIYYSMGKRRNMEAVAERVNRSVRSIANWRKKYLWDDRIVQRELEDNVGGSTAVKTDYRIIINMLMEEAANRIESGEIKVESIEDLEKLVRLDLLLMGEPIRVTEEIAVIDLPESIRALLDAKIEELRQKK